MVARQVAKVLKVLKVSKDGLSFQVFILSNCTEYELIVLSFQSWKRVGPEVLGRLGPGQLGPGHSGPRALLSTLKKWTIWPRTVGPWCPSVPSTWNEIPLWSVFGMLCLVLLRMFGTIGPQAHLSGAHLSGAQLSRAQMSGAQ